MAEGINIEITNIADIRRAFRLAPSLMVRELNVAIRQSVIRIGAESRRNTPVDTGRLRASTYERINHLRGEIGTNTSYDIYVHWGTRKMKARPYLQEAVEGNKNDVQRYFTGAVDRVLHDIGVAT